MHGEDHNINLWLPTNLIFSDLIATVGAKTGRKYAADAMGNVTPEQLRQLFREFRRIKRKYGSWELVEVRSSEGYVVSVIL